MVPLSALAYYIERAKDWVCEMLVAVLPVRVVYWCVIRALKKAAAGEVTPHTALNIPAEELLQRLEEELSND